MYKIEVYQNKRFEKTLNKTFRNKKNAKSFASRYMSNSPNLTTTAKVVRAE